jgi:Short C-terminal domain
MSVADELRKLQELHQSGALTDEEYADAKGSVLAGPADRPEDSGVKGHLHEIRHQNDIAQLDREWAMERDRYMVAGRWGYRYVPSRGMSLLGGVVITVFGVIWTMMTVSMGAPGFFPLFGVVFILFGLGASAYAFIKASEYEAGYKRYRQRRAALMNRRDDSEPG